MTILDDILDLEPEPLAAERVDAEDPPAAPVPASVVPAAVTPAAPVVAVVDEALLAELAGDGVDLAALDKFKGKTPADLIRMQRETEALVGRQGAELAKYRQQAPAAPVPVPEPIAPDVPAPVRAALTLPAETPDEVRKVYRESAARVYAEATVDGHYERHHTAILDAMLDAISIKELSGELDADEAAEKRAEAEQLAVTRAQERAARDAWRDGYAKLATVEASTPKGSPVAPGATPAPVVTPEAPAPVPVTYDEATVAALAADVSTALPAASWPGIDVQKDIVPRMARYGITREMWEATPAEQRTAALEGEALEVVKEKAVALYQQRRTSRAGAPVQAGSAPVRGGGSGGSKTSALEDEVFGAERREREAILARSKGAK